MTARSTRPPTGGDDGSITVWAVLASLAMILAVGLAVDLGGRVHTQQRARDVATQAARVAGQQIQAAPAVRGHGVRADVPLAVAAATTYLAAAGDVTGSASVGAGGTTIVVTTAATYQTKFLGIMGVSTLPVTGHATARIVRAVAGAER